MRMDATENAPGGAPIARARGAVERALAELHLVDLSWLGDLQTYGPWRLAEDALRLVGSLVRHLAPRQIIEFGSGLSTRLLLGETQRLAPYCRIISVDHDPDYAYSAPDDDRLTLIIAPIVARQFCDVFLPTYRIDNAAFTSHPPADMVIVDAPPATLGGREGALYQAISLSRPGTVILLDDANRDQERAALQRVEETLGDAIEILRPEGFRKGLAILIVHEPIAISDLCNARLGTIRRHIRSAVDPAEPIAIVGDQLWRNQIAPGYEALPFLGLEFDCWESPADDRQAIAALAAQQSAGVRYLAITWPDFWWAEIYREFFNILDASSREVVRSAALWLFELNTKDSSFVPPPSASA
jgi:predicted O-methyltransferase YrrM